MADLFCTTHRVASTEILTRCIRLRGSAPGNPFRQDFPFVRGRKLEEFDVNEQESGKKKADLNIRSAFLNVMLFYLNNQIRRSPSLPTEIGWNLHLLAFQNRSPRRAESNRTPAYPGICSSLS